MHETAGAWATVSSIMKRQEALVEAYADEITYHVGDEREMQLCHKEYKGKIGPKLYRETMFKVCVFVFFVVVADSFQNVRRPFFCGSKHC